VERSKAIYESRATKVKVNIHEEVGLLLSAKVRDVFTSSVSFVGQCLLLLQKIM
jgi:hypothetical protein